jgi:ABC-type multidrug transport system fused ATPase/permease subunit
MSKMVVAQGRVDVGGSIAYVPQSPWVQNLSLRDNILFGMPYDEARYKAVIHCCALELDLKILPKGDASMAGERGINLSGGQRQRVCLARAAYHDAQLLLLDNPLSAVDQHTSKHIFDKCIKGLLAEKAVVLIAHQLELLPQVSWLAGVPLAFCAKQGATTPTRDCDPPALVRH